VTDPLAQLRKAVAAFPQRLAEATEQAQVLAEQPAVGEAGDGAVTVVANGAGGVTEVRIWPDRAWQREELAEYVIEATNAALDSAEAMARTIAEDTGGYGADEAMRAFDQRMNDVLAQLDGVTAQLEALIDAPTAVPPAPAKAPAPEKKSARAQIPTQRPGRHRAADDD
jgi:DNA-binding protein YbaB